jgi:hypothetical protein
LGCLIMTTWVVRKSWSVGADTGGAPALTGQAGSLITLLDFLRVTTCGWTKPFTGTNTAVYMAPVGTTRMCLSVDDTGTMTARIRGFEVATGALTGLGQFPTETLFAGGLYLWKSSTADATARKYLFWSNGKMCHLVVNVNAGTSGPQWYAWGDTSSLKAGGETMGKAFIMLNPSAAPSYAAGAWFWNNGHAAIGGHYMSRSVGGSNIAVGVNKWMDWSLMAGTSTFLGSGNFSPVNLAASYQPFPSPLAGGMNLSKLTLHEYYWGTRAILPGVAVLMHARGNAAYYYFNEGDVFTVPAGGLFAGRSYEVIQDSYANGFTTYGMILAETSDTWDV